MDAIAIYPRTYDVGVMKQRATARTQAFFEYWASKRHGRRMPARADIDPVEMTGWLPGIQLIDVSENPRQLRYRLVGDVEVQLRGCSHRGWLVDDVFSGSSKREVLQSFNLAIDEKRMLFDWARYTSAIGHVMSPETIILPLSDDDEHVNMVVTYTVVNKTHVGD